MGDGGGGLVRSGMGDRVGVVGLGADKGKVKTKKPTEQQRDAAILCRIVVLTGLMRTESNFISPLHFLVHRGSCHRSYVCLYGRRVGENEAYK